MKINFQNKNQSCNGVITYSYLYSVFVHTDTLALLIGLKNISGISASQ